jgi:hypothetical protein
MGFFLAVVIQTGIKVGYQQFQRPILHTRDDGVVMFCIKIKDNRSPQSRKGRREFFLNIHH